MAQEAETMDLPVAVLVLAVPVNLVDPDQAAAAVDTPTLAEATAAKAAPMPILAIQVLRTEAVTS